jgi:hypothetical protein
MVVNDDNKSDKVDTQKEDSKESENKNLNMVMSPPNQINIENKEIEEKEENEIILPIEEKSND